MYRSNSILIFRHLFATFVFFQAEDGIRYLVRSRGLGDVYKRQPPGPSVDPACKFAVTAREGRRLPELHRGPGSSHPVSYTHLTLPTSDLV